ncbi:DUF4279 domain-containing protein [Nocardia neocaledoniensis]|jgi:hypothetical protein|uniref:DUF4279 domain-containing protein n=1 Tax=Nocardia neocaledoniensis TaxID=236511 RepID=UPI00245383F4|nr:DUF4279 domain-containing protein [Nocardia neocaledoniensis]
MTIGEYFEVAVSLRLTGAFEPERVTAALGLAPSKQWRTGQPGAAPKLRRSSDGWVLKLVDNVGRVDDSVQEAVDRLKEIDARLRPILDDPNISGYLAVSVDTPANCWPSIALSSSTLSFLASTGLSFDIDVM